MDWIGNELENNKPLELDDTLNDLGDEAEPLYQLIDNDQILHISEVDVRHAGRYSCLAESRAGRAEKDITAPVMALDQTNIEIIENESHTLDCPLENDGGSTTELHWTKDEMPIIPPRIEDPHGYRTLEALVNDSVQIDCIASGVPTPKIEWSHNGRSLSSEDSASLYFENGRSKLHILSVQPKNAGIYSCTATNKAGNSDMDIFLDVIGPPTIRAPATELNVIEGSEQRLECVVGGHPSPRVEWRKSGSSDNDPLAVQQQQQEEDKQAEERAIFTEHSYFLHIHSAGQQHAGRYTCIAKNKGGEDRLAIQLNVLVPPSIDEGERLLRVIEGGTASFECPAKGSPTPKILWRRMPHGTVINSEDENVQLEGIGVNRNILLIKALKPEGAGRYMCEASNEAGNATAEFLLEILRRPILFANPSNLMLRVLEGAQAKFECQANGNPEPSVSWLRAGRPIGEETTSLNNNLIFSPRGDSLMLVKARRSDSGEYTCRLNNSVGEAEATFTLTVLVPPHINETLDQNPRALRNQEIRLNCPVIGFPTPTVQWLKDGKQLHFTERIIRGKVSDYQNDLWLEAVNANDAGRYTCQAVNEVGQLNTDFELEVIAPPEFASEGKRNFEVIEGDSVTLVCPVEANPFPEITWLHGTDPIDTKNAYFSDDKKNLTLLHAYLSDGGKYICNATNEAGNSELDL
uniref:Ig-like domain-containing protein n=1 Tax=Meloidogyne floridensis TaxID=298350 RepID=A0A915P5D8_9BILA